MLLFHDLEVYVTDGKILTNNAIILSYFPVVPLGSNVHSFSCQEKWGNQSREGNRPVTSCIIAGRRLPPTDDIQPASNLLPIPPLPLKAQQKKGRGGGRVDTASARAAVGQHSDCQSEQQPSRGRPSWINTAAAHTASLSLYCCRAGLTSGVTAKRAA